MTTYLTDLMAREHVERMLAEAAAGRTAREARGRRRMTTARHTEARREAGAHPVRHAAALPFVGLRHWLAAGRL